MTDKLDLTLLTTGVPGLDTILGDGLPELSFNIIGGAPGSGKTTFAQQIMFALATPSCRALFFTAMGEPPVKMLRYQQQFSFFDFDKVGTSINFISLAPAVERLRACMATRATDDILAAHRAILTTFIDLMTTLIGARLTVQFMRAAFPADSAGSTTEEKPG